MDLGHLKARPPEARAGEEQYYCGFDSLNSCGHEGSRTVDTVLLVGSQGALDVFKVEKEKLECVGRLDGLRGAVHDAKILPWTLRYDPLRTKRPLVTVVLHGPLILQATTGDDEPTTSTLEPQQYVEPSPRTMGSTARTPVPVGGHRSSEITHYQTTVEVYSLKTQEHITTLLTCPASALTTPVLTPLFTPPPQVGNLKINANGKFISVASGTSGEVFIFGLEGEGDDKHGKAFTCIGKTWTSVQLSTRRSISSSRSSAVSDNPYEDPEPDHTPFGTPMVSLSHRWLAVVPPVPSSSFSINATALVSEHNPKPPGLGTHTAPSQPQLTCSVDSPGAEGLLNKVAREVAQEFIKGAKWVSDQSVQAWKSYWWKPPDSNPTAGPLRNKNEILTPSSRQAQQHFPPTHAHEETGPQSANDHALVSILDLDKLLRTQETRPAAVSTPIATFQTPYGCSFISFAPNGLMLLTASRKGDVQYIWDLMRIIHGKGDTLGTQDIINKPGSESELQGPLVRQVARYARMTVASIMDVVWTTPRGDRLVIVTENGTAHIFELPTSAFHWPPPRRSLRPSTAAGSTTLAELDNEIAIDDKPTSNAFVSAINMVNVKSQPLLATIRSRPPSISNPFSAVGGFGVTSAVGARGGKVVAAGISKSVGAASGTVNTLRHVGENRLHLPGSANTRTAGSVRWMNGRDQGHLAVVGGGVLRIYGVARSTAGDNKGGSKRPPPIISGRPVELPLPTISEDKIAPAVVEYLRADGDDHDHPFVIGGYWSLQTSPTAARKPIKPTAHPLSFAEIETNPPYQPFHTDPRVTLSVYDNSQFQPSPSTNTDQDQAPMPWIFGRPIPATKLDLGSATPELGDETMENVTTVQKRDDGDETHREQVVVTTRRRRGRPVTGVDEEEFFEDDCEVVDFAADRV
ncbi:hypothetical protein MMC16_002327 [Acarospora aff. strigata]|nr:hypothetical protein [Acarospora aff. strigata]